MSLPDLGEGPLMRVTESPAELFSLVVDVTRGVFLGLFLVLLGVTVALLILG